MQQCPQYRPAPQCFCYLQWRRLKTDTLYEIGDMSDNLFHTYDVSFGFLKPAGKVFQAWPATNICTSKFFSLPMLQNWRTRERGQLILGAQTMTRVRTVWNTGWSISTIHFFLISTQFCTIFISHYSYRCFLFAI
jgi:hypothetical protein